MSAANAPAFVPTAIKAVTGRWRACIDIWCPDVKGDDRRFKKKAKRNEGNAANKEGLIWCAWVTVEQQVKACGASCAIDEGNAK